MSVSVLVPTRDEESNIEECLRSVAWSDDVVVVDSSGTDATASLARRHGARVVRFDWNGQLPKKKNWALANVEWKHDWVLILDADERVSADLAQEIPRAVADTAACGYLLKRRLFFMGRWIRHCGYYPAWTLRLFRHERGRYEILATSDRSSGDNEVHEHVVVGGTVARLENELLHFAYPDINSWVEKHNRYSSWEAAVELEALPGDPLPDGALNRRRRLRRLARRLPFRPTLRFLHAYFLQLGFLDGYAGFALCRLLATYELLSLLKSREMQMRRSLDRADA